MSEVFSPYIVAVLAGFVISQLIKAVIAVMQHQHRGIRANMFVSGGMPSSHSTTIMAVWTTVLLVDGVGSGLFGLASAVALVVLYDAVKVRRSSGEQGVALIALIKEQKSTIGLPRVAMGHTPAEVIVGAILGVVVGFGVVMALGA
ncbi:MAG: divergent PAP2 family protein [Candidatus Microsaccharimonas sp.]